MLRGVEHVAPAPHVQQEVEREPPVAEGVGQADREVRRAVVAPVDERGRADRQARRRVDQQLPPRRAVGGAQVEQPRERLGREAGRGAVAHVLVQPRVRHVRLGQRVGQPRHAPLVLVEVGDEVPVEPPRAHRRAAQAHLDAGVARARPVQVEQDEAGAVAVADVVDDLVGRRLPVRGHVEPEPVAEEAELGAHLVRPRELGLEVRVGAGEAVPVAAAHRGLALEGRPVGVGPCVAPDLGVRRAHLAGHVAPDRREGVGEHEARRHRRVEERVRALGDRRRPVVAALEREVQVPAVVEHRLPVDAHQPPLRVGGAAVARTEQKRPQHRQISQNRHARGDIAGFLLFQTANHDGLPISHPNARVGGSRGFFGQSRHRIERRKRGDFGVGVDENLLFPARIRRDFQANTRVDEVALPVSRIDGRHDVALASHENRSAATRNRCDARIGPDAGAALFLKRRQLHEKLLRKRGERAVSQRALRWRQRN